MRLVAFACAVLALCALASAQSSAPPVSYLTPLDFPSYPDDVDLVARSGAAAFGPFLLIPMGEPRPDSAVLVAKYNVTAKRYVEYDQQPFLFHPVGDACQYIAMADTGRGLCSGGRDVHWIEYDFATERFSIEWGRPSHAAADFGRCFTHRNRAFVYDRVAASFVYYEWSAVGGAWVPTAGAIPAAVEAMGTALVREEIAVFTGTNTLIYRSGGPGIPLLPLYSIPSPADPLDLVYAHADALLVIASLGNALVVHDAPSNVFGASAAYSVALPSLSADSRLAADSYLSSAEAKVVATDPLAGTLYVLEGGGAAPLAVSHAIADQTTATDLAVNTAQVPPTLPLMSVASDPLAPMGGRVQLACLAGGRCAGCGISETDLDNDLCTVELSVDTGAGVPDIFETFVLPTTVPLGSCRRAQCDPVVGYHAVYDQQGAPCALNINNLRCAGTCAEAGCVLDFSACTTVAY